MFAIMLILFYMDGFIFTLSFQSNMKTFKMLFWSFQKMIVLFTNTILGLLCNAIKCLSQSDDDIKIFHDFITINFGPICLSFQK